MAQRDPHFIAYSVTETNGRSRWRKIGVAFWNRKESALTVLVDAFPLGGRLVLRTRRALEAEGREVGAEG